MILPKKKSRLTLKQVCQGSGADETDVLAGFRGVIISQPCSQCGEELPITLPENSEYFKLFAETGNVPMILNCPKCGPITGFRSDRASLVYSNTNGEFTGEERSVIPMIENLPGLGDLFPEKIRLVMTKRSADWHVYIYPNQRFWAAGTSPENAIGELIRSRYREFGLGVAARSVNRDAIGKAILHDLKEQMDRLIGLELHVVVVSPGVDYHEWIANPDPAILKPFHED